MAGPKQLWWLESNPEKNWEKCGRWKSGMFFLCLGVFESFQYTTVMFSNFPFVFPLWRLKVCFKMSYAWIITNFLQFWRDFQAPIHGYLFLPSQPQLLSPQVRNKPQYNCFSSWHKIRAGKRKNLPEWLSMKENRKVSSPWSFQHLGGSTHPSSAARYGTIRIHCPLATVLQLSGGIHSSWGRNVQHRPLPGYVLLTAFPSCTYRVKETTSAEKVAKS